MQALIVCLSQHYLRLYIYAFAFQAHVQRSVSTSEDGKKVAETVIFPRGPMGSPDARFILEAIDAAVRLNYHLFSLPVLTSANTAD